MRLLQSTHPRKHVFQKLGSAIPFIGWLADEQSGGALGGAILQPSGPGRAGASAFVPREKEILKLLTWGAAHKEISDQPSLSINTMRMHISGIYRKLHIHSRGEAAAKHSQT